MLFSRWMCWCRSVSSASRASVERAIADTGIRRKRKITASLSHRAQRIARGIVLVLHHCNRVLHRSDGRTFRSLAKEVAVRCGGHRALQRAFPLGLISGGFINYLQEAAASLNSGSCPLPTRRSHPARLSAFVMQECFALAAWVGPHPVVQLASARSVTLACVRSVATR